MSDDLKLKLDPNSADKETLQKLPGVGPELAERIIAARPFDRAEDLIRVQGIGKAALARNKLYLVIEESSGGAELDIEKDQAMLEPEARLDEGASDKPKVKVGEKATQDKDKPIHPKSHASAAEPKAPKALKRPETKSVPKPAAESTAREPRFNQMDTLWLIFGSVILSVVFSVILNLMILGGINGTLNFGRHRAIKELSSLIGQASGDLEDLSGHIEGIERRLDALEGLSGRMVSIEDQVDSLTAEVNEALVEVADLKGAMDELSQTTKEMEEQIGIFDTFLKGLNLLMLDLLPAEESEAPPVP
jgi:competence protein ComEA